MFHRGAFYIKHSLVVFLLMMAGMLFLACHQRQTETLTQNLQQKEIEAKVAACPDIKSLITLVDSFKNVGDGNGEMLALSALGHDYRDASNYLKASEAHQREFSLAQDLNDSLQMARALNDLGTNYRRMGLYYDALDHHTRSLIISQHASLHNTRNFHICQAVSYNGMENVYMSIGNYAQADSLLRMALKTETGLHNYYGLNIDNSNIGMVFEKQGLLDSAMVYFLRSYDYSKRCHSRLGMAYSHTNFGRIYEQQKRYDKALEEYNKSFELIDHEHDLWLWLQPCIAVARINMLTGHKQQATLYLDKALRTALSINSPEQLIEIYRLYSTLYNKEGDYRKALDSYALSSNYADSMLNLKKVFEIQNLRLSLTRQQREAEIAQMKTQLHYERRMKTFSLTLLVVGLLLATTLIVFLWYSLRLRTRTQRVTQQLQKARENFFTNITHEFRTPLTVILGIGERLRQAKSQSKGKALSEGDIQKAGETIGRQGDSLLQLVNQLLDISKVRSAIGKEDWRHGNVVPMLQMMVESYCEYAKNKNISLLFAKGEETVEMDFVPHYLRKILGNLLSNALKFTREGGKVEVRCRQEGSSELLLEVEDNGVGMAPEVLQHIFEPFYQADLDSANIGSGIGLALVSQIVEAMKGTITVKSQVGEGSVFTVVLPLCCGEGVLPEYHQESDSDVVMAMSGDTDETKRQVSDDGDMRTRILIVEDNADVAHFIGSLLESRYALSYAGNGAEGFEVAHQWMPDLVITDLMMPVMDGYTLCRKIRLSPLLNHIPVIVITARTAEEDRVKGLEAGADAYLNKPFNAEELNVRVAKLLEQRAVLREKYSHALHEGREQQVKLPDGEQVFVNQLKQFVKTRMEASVISVEALAEYLDMSASQLRRKVYAVTGDTPVGYLSKVHMSIAKQLLDSHPDCTIGDIAAKCGFDDAAHFSRAFRKVYGQTPSQHRSSAK
jgi:two-component system sensor histidine kinase ChiS